MSRRLVTAAAAAIACLPMLLGGCSAFRNQPHPAVADNDIPQAGSLNPQKSQALFLAVIDGLRDEGQSRAALAYLDAFDGQHPGVPYAGLLRAECLTDVGKLTEAEPVFAQLLGTQYSAAAYAGQGSIAAARGDWGGAVSNFQEAVRLEPSKAKYASDLGFAQVRQGDYAGGIEMLGRAAQLEPGNSFIRNNLILGLHLAGQDREAGRIIAGIDPPGDRRDANMLMLVSAQTLASQTGASRQQGSPVGDDKTDASAKSTDKGSKL